MSEDTEPYIILDGNRPVVMQHTRASVHMSRDTIMAYGYWAGYTLDMISSGSAPFVRYKTRDKSKASYHFTAYSLAPFFVLADVIKSELKFGIRAMRGSALSADNYLSQWFYEWPWSGCRMIKPENSDVSVTKIVLLSVVPFVEIIIDVPSYVMDTLYAYGNSYTEPTVESDSGFKLLER